MESHSKFHGSSHHQPDMVVDMSDPAHFGNMALVVWEMPEELGAKNDHGKNGERSATVKKILLDFG